MLAPTIMSRYSVGKSDVWISGTSALVLSERVQKNGKIEEISIYRGSLAIKLFLPNNQMLSGQKQFYDVEQE